MWNKNKNKKKKKKKKKKRGQNEKLFNIFLINVKDKFNFIRENIN